ncbi:probable glutathione S-transferase [Durio zibethinus]|uniref:glutathione transferase n=1 Tax=Durio zibethinus TaxID=66656 RepID=A0A6P5YI33_DURZI|nr:probable glutathione S-transferase [Durio zibethinus]
MAAKEEVKLLGFWVSPFVLRVEWALKIKGVKYEYIEEDIFDKSTLLMELNPVHRKVPVLVHDGTVIAESFVILEYIDETWKQNPLLPQDPYQRALARFWAKFAEEKIFEGAWNALCSQGEEKQKALQQTIEAVETLEGELQWKQQFFGGESIGYTDIILGWISYYLPIWEEVGSMKILDPVKFPATVAWINRFLKHPVIKDTFPRREMMLVYFHQRSEALGSTSHGWLRV